MSGNNFQTECLCISVVAICLCHLRLCCLTGAGMCSNVQARMAQTNFSLSGKTLVTNAPLVLKIIGLNSGVVSLLGGN